MRELTSGGHVRFATVPEKLDLAQDNTEIVDALTVQSQVVQTLAERSGEPGKTVEVESRASKTDSLVTVPTMRTGNDGPNCEDGKRVLGLHQILPPGSRNLVQKARRPLCFPVNTNHCDNVSCCYTLHCWGRETENAWHGSGESRKTRSM